MLSIVAALAISAPAPLPKEVGPWDLVGTWQLEWAGLDGTWEVRCNSREDCLRGVYYQTVGTTTYYGLWEWRDGQMHATELVLPDGSTPVEWTYKFARSVRGGFAVTSKSVVMFLRRPHK